MFVSLMAVPFGLMIWIAVQLLIIPLSFPQPTVFTIGAVQGFVAVFWLRRRGTGQAP